MASDAGIVSVQPPILRIEVRSKFLTMTLETRKTVLVADDAVDLADLVAILVRRKGCNAITAHNGVEAVAAAVEHKPDLILMDIRMPIMDGYEASRRILSIPELARIPIIAVSAHCDGDWAERAKEAGCVLCVPKPVEPQGLQAILDDFIGPC
jgi:two-component system cell cycle response regulator DivK